MYIEIGRIKGGKDMSNEAIKVEFDKLGYPPIHDDAEGVEAEKKAGFLLYEDGCWVQYIEDMTK
jgi:hypothetical protein